MFVSSRFLFILVSKKYHFCELMKSHSNMTFLKSNTFFMLAPELE